MSKRGRRLTYALAIVVLLFHLGGGWYFADQLRADALIPNHANPSFETTIVELGSGTATLRSTGDDEADLTAAGIVGIDWQTGYGQLGEIVSELDDGSVVRRMTRFDGEAPRAGTSADLDGYAFPGDPDRAFGLAYSDVNFRTPVGEMSAWEIFGTSGLWVIHVHGLGASKTEALRLVRPIAGAGHPQLVIAYRNDDESPSDPSGLYRYGLSEWEDIAAAVDFVTAEGAERVVLIGYSTGAAHILSYLYQTSDSPVVGAVFDSPNIDFEQTVDLGASQRRLPLVPLRLPGSLIWAAKRIASFRFGLDWQALDYIPRAVSLTVPVLTFHGTADETVPLASSQEFLAVRPDLVQLVIVPEAGHVRSWNVGPESYERRVIEFLSDLSG